MNMFFSILDTFCDYFIKPISFVVGLFIAFAFFTGIVSRSILGDAIFGLEELILISVVWLYMFGAVLASKEDSHLKADFIPLLVKNEKAVMLIRMISIVISIVLAVFFLTWAYSLVSWGIEKRQSTPIFSIPWVVSQISMLFASCVMVLYLLRDLCKAAKKYSEI